jgi:hypothetical protein
MIKFNMWMIKFNIMSPRFRAGRCAPCLGSKAPRAYSFAPARRARRVEGSDSASGKERQVEELGELIGLYDKKRQRVHWRVSVAGTVGEDEVPFSR